MKSLPGSGLSFISSQCSAPRSLLQPYWTLFNSSLRLSPLCTFKHAVFYLETLLHHHCLTGSQSFFKPLLKCHLFLLPEQMVYSHSSTYFPCSKTTLGMFVECLYPQLVHKLPEGRECVCLFITAWHPYCSRPIFGTQLTFVSDY